MASLWRSWTVTGFRRLLYAVTPNETTFANATEVPDYTSEAAPFFLVCVILEALVCILTGHRKPRINDGVTSVSAGLFSQLPASLGRSIEIWGYIWVYEHWHVFELPWDSVWTWWFCFLATDCGYYWFHRCAHEVNILWAAHQVHHSSEDYNLATALRQSILQKYTSWVFYLPMAWFGIPPQQFLVHIQFNILFQFWIHTQAIRSLGPLEYILNTPSHHRVHHGRNRYCIDKNYAGTLIIWDRLFGTFAKEEEEVVYGLVHPINTWNLFTIQFCHLKYMWGRFWSLDGIKNKMSFIVNGPGWSPGTPRLGNIEDIPYIKAPQPYYDKQPSLVMSLYISSHFLIVLLGYMVYLTKKSSLEAHIILLILGYFILSLHSFGLLNNGIWYCSQMEFLRCLLFLGLDWFLLGGTSTLVMKVLRTYFMLSSAMWCIQSLQSNVVITNKKYD